MNFFNLRWDGELEQYLAGIEMSINLDDDLVIFIWCLLPGHHHLGGCQVLQLVHLETQLCSL